MDILLGPAHLGDVDEALDARLQLHEGTVVGDVRNGALDAGADRILCLDRLPRIGAQTGYFAESASAGSACSCFMQSEMRCVSGLMRMICTFTVSPTLRISDG